MSHRNKTFGSRPYTDYSVNSKVTVTTPVKIHCEEIKTAGDRIKVEHGEPYTRSKSPVSDFYKDGLSAARSRSVSSCSSRASDNDINLKDLQAYDEHRASLNPSRTHSRKGSQRVLEILENSKKERFVFENMT